MTGRYFQLKPGQNALLCLPTHHIAGQMMVVRAFELGLNLITTAPNALSLTELANQTIDFAAMLPLQVHHLVFSAPSQLERISALLIGGAPVSPTLLNALQHIKTAVYQSYGMTETASHIALRRLNSPQPEAYYTVLEEISIDQDERDCLIVHAPSLGIDSLVTQDVVTRHSATEFELLGRCDHVINSGGIKFYPEQLEEKLANVITERRFFIAGEPDEKLGQRLILVIEGKPFHQTELVQLQHRIETRLSRYERPKTIHFLAQFQETSSGKIKRV
jgi:O-succinylbenzoic acid--CoA ligase